MIPRGLATVFRKETSDSVPKGGQVQGSKENQPARESLQRVPKAGSRPVILVL
jgi:hypothetical protein